MALPVGVLAAHFLAGHVEDDEVALRRERNLGDELAGRQAAAQVGDEREAVHGRAAD